MPPTQMTNLHLIVLTMSLSEYSNTSGPSLDLTHFLCYAVIVDVFELNLNGCLLRTMPLFVCH